MPSRKPSGTTRLEPYVGQSDSMGIGFPCGNARAWSVDVSRQYEALSKMRYVSSRPAT